MNGRPCLNLILSISILFAVPFIFTWAVLQIRPDMKWVFEIFFALGAMLSIEVLLYLTNKKRISYLISHSRRDKLAWYLGFSILLFSTGLAKITSWNRIYDFILLIIGCSMFVFTPIIFGTKEFRSEYIKWFRKKEKSNQVD